jgi:predicted RNA-binding Zn-ribbon protein involved in translation (DUF1610 family)
MTLNTFKSNVRAYRISEILRGALFFCLLGAAALPTFFVASRSDRGGFDNISVLVVSASYAVIAALMFYVLAPMRRKHLRWLQGQCSSCGRLLLGRHARAVLATGRCPDCGNQVFR